MLRQPTSSPIANCTHRPPCSACPRFGDPQLAEPALDALASLARQHALPPVGVLTASTAGFRTRARLAIRGRRGSPKIGLFEAGTHRVVHIPHCSVQHPLINHVASIARRALVETSTTCYSDGAHLGLARYLQVVVERRSQTAQVVLVANAPEPAPLAACLDLIRERLGAQLHSLWFNANCGQSNTILGPEFVHWAGLRNVNENFGGADIHYPPGAFGQSNLEVAEAIIRHVRTAIPPGARVVEFYAGVGAIGLSVLDSIECITLNEISPHSLQGLETGVAALDAADRQKITIAPGIAGHVAALATDGKIVIVDPPRKGLDLGLLEHLEVHAPARLIYISCGLESFVADCERLSASGKLRLTRLHAFNLLPFTDHVETVACFDRY